MTAKINVRKDIKFHSIDRGWVYFLLKVGDREAWSIGGWEGEKENDLLDRAVEDMSIFLKSEGFEIA